MPGYLGQGRTNGKIIYVPIPKNASSAHNATFKEGWERIWFHSEVAPYPAYVVVRDPVDRWYSGAAMWERRGKGKDLETMIEEVKNGRSPVYDEHTFRQSDFVLSSLHELVLVPMERATQFVWETFGLQLARIRGRQTKPSDSDLNPILEKFYAEDMELYQQALRIR